MEVCDRECPSLYEEVNAEEGKSVLDNASCSFTYKDCKYWFSHSADSTRPEALGLRLPGTGAREWRPLVGGSESQARAE